MIHLERAALSRRLAAFFAVAAVPCAVSCSAAPAGDPAQDGVAVTTQESSAGADLGVCPITSQYLVLGPVGSGLDPTCAPVPGRGGRWTLAPGWGPAPCTPVVEGATDAVLCSYVWTPRGSAAPDVAALVAIPGVLVASRVDSGNPACDEDATLRFATLLSEGGVQCKLPHGHGDPNGPKGCDV